MILPFSNLIKITLDSISVKSLCILFFYTYLYVFYLIKDLSHRLHYFVFLFNLLSSLTLFYFVLFYLHKKGKSAKAIAKSTC